MKWSPICNLTLTGPEAVDKFPNVRGYTFHEDASCLALMRAIVWPRMQKSDSIRFKPVEMPSFRVTDDGLKVAEAHLSSVLGDPKKANHLLYISFAKCVDSFSNDYEMNEKLRAWIMKFAESVFDGYQHNTKVELFAQRNHRIAVAMTNNSTRSSVFLCMNSWAFGYRMLEISLPRLLPWYFPEEHLRRDGFEYKLLKLLADGEYTSFKRLLNKVGRRMLQEDD